MAMVTGVSLHDLISSFGHDGSEIVFPNLQEPMCRAGFTIPEIIKVALKLGWSVTPIDEMPQVTPDGIHIRNVFYKGHLEIYFNNYSGIVAGPRIDAKWWHDVAWDHKSQLWLDPSGPQLPRNKCPVKIEVFYIFSKICT